MKLLWIGDPHLKLSNLKEAELFLAQVKKLINDTNPDKVIIAGDLLDTFAVIRSEVLDLWSKFFRDIKDCYVIVGNHDMAGVDNGVHALEAFKAYPGVTIVDEEFSIYADGMTICMLPFFRDKPFFEATCKTFHGDYLFCHQSFNGAQFENGFFDPHGADPECVSGFKAVLSGHVHKEQQFKNIYYPGTPFQHNFGDAGEAKGVFTIELTKEGYNVLEKHTLDMPTFNVIEMDSIPTLLNKITRIEPNKSSNYKLVATGTAAEIAAFWKDPIVIDFKSKARRVVDSLTSTKPLNSLNKVSGSTQEEKFKSYVESKKWRVPGTQLIAAANRLLSN